MLHLNALHESIDSLSSLSLTTFEDYQDFESLSALAAREQDLTDYAVHCAQIIRNAVLEQIYPSIKTAYNEWLLDGPTPPALSRAVKLELGL